MTSKIRNWCQFDIEMCLSELTEWSLNLKPALTRLFSLTAPLKAWHSSPSSPRNDKNLRRTTHLLKWLNFKKNDILAGRMRLWLYLAVQITGGKVSKVPNPRPMTVQRQASNKLIKCRMPELSCTRLLMSFILDQARPACIKIEDSYEHTAHSTEFSDVTNVTATLKRAILILMPPPMPLKTLQETCMTDGCIFLIASMIIISLARWRAPLYNWQLVIATTFRKTSVCYLARSKEIERQLCWQQGKCSEVAEILKWRKQR